MHPAGKTDGARLPAPNRTLGTTRGFRIYYTDPFSKCFESTDGNISLLEMLFSTSLVAFVLSPRRLQIKNTKVRPNLDLSMCQYHS